MSSFLPFSRVSLSLGHTHIHTHTPHTTHHSHTYPLTRPLLICPTSNMYPTPLTSLPSFPCNLHLHPPPPHTQSHTHTHPPIDQPTNPPIPPRIIIPRLQYVPPPLLHHPFPFPFLLPITSLPLTSPPPLNISPLLNTPTHPPIPPLIIIPRLP